MMSRGPLEGAGPPVTGLVVDAAACRGTTQPKRPGVT